MSNKKESAFAFGFKAFFGVLAAIIFLNVAVCGGCVGLASLGGN